LAIKIKKLLAKVITNIGQGFEIAKIIKKKDYKRLKAI